jgi:hypothetical protein
MRLIAVLWMGLAAACARSDAQRGDAQAAVVSADTAHPWRKPGDRVDSILPMDEHLRRFRTGLAQPVRFEGGAPGREALARRFLAAVSAQDTASLARLLLSPAEFAWLVFPDHIYSRPPYELDPAIFWLQLRVESEKGLGRTLRRFGGEPLRFMALSCHPDTVQVRIPVRLWSACSLRYRAGDSVMIRRLFGSMVERDGQVKLVSFASEF